MENVSYQLKLASTEVKYLVPISFDINYFV